MAKFAIGEIALLTKTSADAPKQTADAPSPVGQDVEIIGIGPFGWADYMILFQGCKYGALESWLEKKPTKEDPGLTKLKYLLQFDMNEHKRPIKAVEIES